MEDKQEAGKTNTKSTGQGFLTVAALAAIIAVLFLSLVLVPKLAVFAVTGDFKKAFRSVGFFDKALCRAAAKASGAYVQSATTSSAVNLSGSGPGE